MESRNHTEGQFDFDQNSSSGIDKFQTISSSPFLLSAFSQLLQCFFEKNNLVATQLPFFPPNIYLSFFSSLFLSLSLQENLLLDDEQNLKLIDFGLAARPKVWCDVEVGVSQGGKFKMRIRVVYLINHVTCI